MAAYFDIRKHRIPNGWIICGMGSGLILTLLDGGLWPSVMFFLRMIVVTAVFFVLFFFRMMGAGDIKIAALICGYLGFSTGALSIFTGFFIGAFWSLMKLIGCGLFLSRFSYLFAYIRHVIQTGKITAYYSPKKDGYHIVIPFGVCLFLGTFITLVL